MWPSAPQISGSTNHDPGPGRRSGQQLLEHPIRARAPVLAAAWTRVRPARPEVTPVAILVCHCWQDLPKARRPSLQVQKTQYVTLRPFRSPAPPIRHGHGRHGRSSSLRDSSHWHSHLPEASLPPAHPTSLPLGCLPASLPHTHSIYLIISGCPCSLSLSLSLSPRPGHRAPAPAPARNPWPGRRSASLPYSEAKGPECAAGMSSRMLDPSPFRGLPPGADSPAVDTFGEGGGYGAENKGAFPPSSAILAQYQ